MSFGLLRRFHYNNLAHVCNVLPRRAQVLSKPCSRSRTISRVDVESKTPPSYEWACLSRSFRPRSQQVVAQWQILPEFGTKVAC